MKPAAALNAATLCIFIVLGLSLADKGWAQPSSTTPRVIEALDNIRNVTRPRQDGYATIWEGQAFVQCHALSDQSLSCEAAGATMQPALAQILTPDRKQRLTALGWRLDPSFGAYTQTFSPTLGLDQAADRILSALNQGYGADLTRIDVQTRWVGHQTCPPRHGPGQTLAGLVDDDPVMAATSVHGCTYSGPALQPANGSGGINLMPSNQGTNPYFAGLPVAPEPVATEVVVNDPVAVREPRRRRARRPRASSGRRESTSKRSRSGGHSSHHK